MAAGTVTVDVSSRNVRSSSRGKIMPAATEMMAYDSGITHVGIRVATSCRSGYPSCVSRKDVDSTAVCTPHHACTRKPLQTAILLEYLVLWP